MVLAGATLGFLMGEPPTTPEAPPPSVVEAPTYVEATPEGADRPVPSDLEQVRARQLRIVAGGMFMTRPQLDHATSVDGTSASVPGDYWTNYAYHMRLRARLGFDAGAVGLRIEPQVARTMSHSNTSEGESGRGIGPARDGLHQAYLNYSSPLATKGGDTVALHLRVGRQELNVGTSHVYGPAPWAAGMRSWDGLHLHLEGERGGLRMFAGSLAHPFLSAPQSLGDHLGDALELTWIGQGYWTFGPAATVELGVFGNHSHGGAGLSESQRDIYTPNLTLNGQIYEGLRYHVEGHLQLGWYDNTARQVHRAGQAMGKLSYRSPVLGGRGASSENPEDPSARPPRRTQMRAGGWLGVDYASGGGCSRTENDSVLCNADIHRDFYSPWMARHGHFGWGDRFWASNVIDAFIGPKFDLALPSAKQSFEFLAANHFFAFADPTGQWRDTGGGSIGTPDPDNRNRKAANEVDMRVRHVWKTSELTLTSDLGYVVVANLSGGRKISGERLRQRLYLMIVLNW